MGSLGFNYASTASATTALLPMLDRVGVAIAVLDGEAGLSIFSSALESLLGRPTGPLPVESLPAQLHLYTHDGRRLLSPDETPLARARAGEIVRDALLSVKRPDGTVLILRSNAVPLPASNGDFRGALSVIEDVTVVTDPRTDPHDAALPEALSGPLVDWLNHELRTPLSIIRGHTELLTESGADLPESAKQSLVALQRATHRLTSLAGKISEMGHRSTTEPVGKASDREPVNVRVVHKPTHYRTTRYTVYPTGYSEMANPERRQWLLRVEDAGDGWAVRWRNQCLNYRGDWDFEPPPKSRSADFLKRCRFSERAALNRAQNAIDELLVDGLTFQEFREKVMEQARAKARTLLKDSRCQRPEKATPASWL
jgi:hypothetical protein